jgi:hypothetical protein
MQLGDRVYVLGCRPIRHGMDALVDDVQGLLAAQDAVGDQGLEQHRLKRESYSTEPLD